MQIHAENPKILKILTQNQLKTFFQLISNQL